MPTRPIVTDAATARVAEQQIRNWELSRTHEAHVGRPESAEVPDVHDFVALSRAAGSDGDAIAAELAQRLGWPMFDREVLRVMAGDDAFRERIYRSLDERDLGWLEEMLRSLMASESPRNDYRHRLAGTIFSLARQGPAVFIGRAADLILPRGIGVRVRIESPEQRRAERLAQARDIPVGEARAEIHSVDAERNRFALKWFGAAATDPCRFDLCINEDRMERSTCVDIIVGALERLSLSRST